MEMPKYVKDDYVKGLDEFFSPIGLKVDWNKMRKEDLEALSEVFMDAEKVNTLFGLDRKVADVAEIPDSSGPLGGLFDGGLIDGDLRDKVGRVLNGGIDGAVKALKEEKPLRSQIGSGKLIGRLLQMGGNQ